MKYVELKGVPVFRPGDRRGDHYSADRMRQIVRNSNLARPYFRGIIKTKLTHADAQPDILNQAAFGQSVRYYLMSGKGGPFVAADFAGVPEPIAQAAPHHFPNVSVEKYRMFDSGDGFRAPDVIKSVAFLGSDAPEVKGLKLAFPEVFKDLRGDVELFQMGDPDMANNIKKLREELGMSPEDLAGIIGKTPDEIAQYEDGTQTPDEATLKAIADALGVTPDVLLAEMKQPDNPAKQPDAAKKPAKQPDATKEPAKFSETDMERIVAEAVAKAVAQKDAELFTERKAAKTREITAMIDGWKAQGMPAVLTTMGLQTFMERLNDREVETFGEGGEQLTPIRWFERFVEKFAELGSVPTGERAAGAMDKPDRDNPVNQIVHYAEANKLSYNDAARLLSKQGTVKV